MLNKLLIFLVLSLRPLLGPSGCCKFELSCTDFAVMQLNDQKLFIAIWSIIKRLLVCCPIIFRLAQ